MSTQGRLSTRFWRGCAGNDPVAFGDVTNVHRAATRLGAALLAAAGLMSTDAIADADPAGHQVTYTITSGQEATLSVNYVFASPPSKNAFDANPSAYLRNERISVGPDAPWIFPTTLTDTSWAYVMAGGAARYNGTPNPHCVITVDGGVAADQSGDTAATCALKPW
ncbi:MAG: hypothetical protein QOH60_5195 [Mycobacterium sp.]|jgi:hypothetical protein|nr:hypothetical protein [Mycobacterium sp.]